MPTLERLVGTPDGRPILWSDLRAEAEHRDLGERGARIPRNPEADSRGAADARDDFLVAISGEVVDQADRPGVLVDRGPQPLNETLQHRLGEGAGEVHDGQISRYFPVERVDRLQLDLGAPQSMPRAPDVLSRDVRELA